MNRGELFKNRGVTSINWNIFEKRKFSEGGTPKGEFFWQNNHYSGGMVIIMMEETVSEGKFSEGEKKLIKDKMFWISIYLEEERILESLWNQVGNNKKLHSNSFPLNWKGHAAAHSIYLIKLC